MTDENNQALCEVSGSVNSTMTLVVSTVSTGLVAMTPMVVGSTDSSAVIVTSMSTRITGVGSSSSVSETEVEGTRGVTSTGTLFSGAAQSAGSSTESSAGGVESTPSTTSAEPTASTDASDTSNAPASTTKGSGARIKGSWYGVVGIGVGVGMVTVLMG